MEEMEDAYMKNKSEYLSIKDVEDSLIYVKKYFKQNFDGAILLKDLKRLESRTQNNIDKLYEKCQNPAFVEGREAELQSMVDEMSHHYSCIKIIKEVAIVNNLDKLENLNFINKKNLRKQAEMILKMESPESYEIYIKDVMEEKYGDTYGSFYR